MKTKRTAFKFNGRFPKIMRTPDSVEETYLHMKDVNHYYSDKIGVEEENS